MKEVSPTYLSRATNWLLITTLLYFLMNGAQIFETAAIVPKWAASPPDSFTVFRGSYGLDFKVFWITMHSIHEITFILALILCWKITAVRNGLLALFIVHMGIRVWTILYFVPNILEFERIANSAYTGPDLLARASQWENLNYLRVSLFLAVSLGLLPLCRRLLNRKTEQEFSPSQT